MARRNQQRLAGIIDDLLDLSRIEAGRLDYRFEEVEPGALLAEVREAFEPQAEASGVTLALEPAGALPPALADGRRLAQVLTNLVGNALKFTPRGGRVGLSARVAGDWLELSVEDTGPGIVPEDQPRIFEPFFQGSEQDPLTRTARGTGLGLSISRELARAHGGELAVASVPGRGSRFTLKLPVGPARRDLEERLRQTQISIDGPEVLPPRILGSAVHPDDTFIGSAESLNLGGTIHELTEDPGGRRRAGRAGEPALPAAAGGVRGRNGHRRPGDPGSGPFGPAGPGAPRRDDAAGERLPDLAHAAGG
jgi:hypothetical protein